MENSDFYRNFMSGVKTGTPSIDSGDAAKKQGRRIMALIILGLVVLMAGVIGIVVTITANNAGISEGEEDVLDAEVSEEEPEETEENDSSIYYNNSGEIISIRMTCTNDSSRYDFYKDNTYEIGPTGNVESTEVGTYNIGAGTIIMTVRYGIDRTVRMPDSKTLVDGNINLECEQINDN